MPPRRALGEQTDEARTERDTPPPAPPPAPEPAVLALQRGAGNAAVSRMLARQTATDAPAQQPWSYSPTKKPAFDPQAAIEQLGKENRLGWDKVIEYVDGTISAMVKEGVTSFQESVPELVDAARRQTFKLYDQGDLMAPPRELKVADVVSITPDSIEKLIREKARSRGLTLLDHRALSDRAGVQKEALAALRNLGAKIPDSIEFGGDDAKIKIDISGAVTGSAKLGKVGVDVEGSAEGGKATAKFPGGKASVDVSEKGVKAKLKAGELVDISASILKGKDDQWVYTAELQIGTLGAVITPEDIAKVIAGAQGTLSKGAIELSQGVDPQKVKQHGGEMKEAVEKVVEKAKKSAAQAKPGWQLGAKLQGSSEGGVSGSVTLTWVF